MLEHDLKLEGADPAKHLRKPPAGVSLPEATAQQTPAASG